MKRVRWQRLPYILTGVLVLLAVAAIGIFLALDNTAQTTAPTPTPTGLGGSVIPQPTATPTAPQLGIETTPLITGPLPESATAVGELVAGFPTSIISLPTGAEVVSSAIATEGDRMQATVVATSTASQDEVHRYFERVLTPLGLRGAETPAAPGTTATTWSSGTDSIVVATTADEDVTRFSVFALFTAGKS
ncbi:hypothetical protein [Rhodoglobus aureus]|uniref:Uncharacterized protein n=1 Tax=Rhodoglobus aureus TaxID=191497 RepID=A0ABP4GGX6_9MICO